MKNSKILKGILILLGLPLVILGSWRLFDPIAFFSFNELVLAENAGLLSEARGAGGVVVASGIVILLGAFVQKMSFTSTISAIVIFLGYGVARVIGFMIDGNPGEQIIQGIMSEFVLGLLAVFALVKYRQKT